MPTESDLGVLVRFDSSENTAAVAVLLAKETRPDFEDDLAEWQHPLFFALEGVDYPTELKRIGDNQLYVAWYETGEQLADLDRAITKCGGVITVAYQFADGGDVEELLFKRQGDHLIMLYAEEEGLKVPSDFSENGEYPQILQALLQVF
jgi:hypothetical protein